VTDSRQSGELAAQLRAVVGQLVRTVRVVDTLAPGQADTLGYLDREGPQTTAELAQRRGVRHQTLAKVAKELMADGLVRAEAHPTDARKVLLHLTPEGRSVLDQERRHRTDRLAAAIEDTLTSAQRRELARGVDLLADLARGLQGSRS